MEEFECPDTVKSKVFMFSINSHLITCIDPFSDMLRNLFILSCNKYKYSKPENTFCILKYTTNRAACFYQFFRHTLATARQYPKLLPNSTSSYKLFSSPSFRCYSHKMLCSCPFFFSDRFTSLPCRSTEAANLRIFLV